MKPGNWICEDCGEEFTQDDGCVNDGHICVCEACGEEAWLAECEDRAQWEEECGGIDFANPGSNSALRAATASNPRNLPCPNCGAPNRLTPADRAQGYQCDACADALERGGY